MKDNFEKITFQMKDANNINFCLSRFNLNSIFTDFLNKQISKNYSYYFISEIKGSLDIEGDGSSRKIIKDLISGKRKPQNENEHKAINLHFARKYISEIKPIFNKENLMLIYNMLKQNINMGNNELEDNFDFRKSSDGEVQKFATPNEKVMRKGMDDLIIFWNSSHLDEFIVEKSILVHLFFIYYHPFYDFNGRTGRLLTYWFLTLKNEDSIKDLVYLSLPTNKKQYIKLWNACRKFSWVDLTTFMNWIGFICLHSVKKFELIENEIEKKGFNLTETERLIIFILLDKNEWIQVNQLRKQVDLGISKQGFFNAIKSLEDSKIVIAKLHKNTKFVKSKWIIMKNYIPEHQKLFQEFAKDMSKPNLTLSYD